MMQDHLINQLYHRHLDDLSLLYRVLALTDELNAHSYAPGSSPDDDAPIFDPIAVLDGLRGTAANVVVPDKE